MKRNLVATLKCISPSARSVLRDKVVGHVTPVDTQFPRASIGAHTWKEAEIGLTANTRLSIFFKETIEHRQTSSKRMRYASLNMHFSVSHDEKFVKIANRW